MIPPIAISNPAGSSTQPCLPASDFMRISPYPRPLPTRELTAALVTRSRCDPSTPVTSFMAPTPPPVATIAARVSRWTHLNHPLGLLPANFNVEAVFPIPPAVVPRQATEILVYASVCCLPSAPDTAGRYEIYVSQNRQGDRASFYLVLKPYAGSQRNQNSDNVWLPMPPDRKLHVVLGAYGNFPVENLMGNILSALRLAAYRQPA